VGRTKRKLAPCAAAAVCAFALTAVGSAQAAVTIGSNLANPANDNTPCNATACTVTNLSLPSDVAANGLTSPVNGTVTSWKFVAEFGSHPVSLRVLRPGTGVAMTGIATSSSVMSTVGLNGPLTTSLPIKIGDHVGLDAGGVGEGLLSTGASGTVLYWTLPQLANGSTRDGTVYTNHEVLVQATVDPSNKVEFQAPVLNKKKGTAMLPLHVPNAGTLGYGIMAGTVHGPASTSAEGDVSLIVKATRRARRKLNETGKVKETVLVTFTPTFGTPLQVSHTFKLRKNIKR
jgi:hypothetical protein